VLATTSSQSFPNGTETVVVGLVDVVAAVVVVVEVATVVGTTVVDVATVSFVDEVVVGSPRCDPFPHPPTNSTMAPPTDTKVRFTLGSYGVESIRNQGRKSPTTRDFAR
jgi:hypothetical protein